MRKLILLALSIGALELLKRSSQQQGLTPSAVLLGAAERGLNWFRGPKKAGKAVQLAACKGRLRDHEQHKEPGK